MSKKDVVEASEPTEEFGISGSSITRIFGERYEPEDAVRTPPPTAARVPGAPAELGSLDAAGAPAIADVLKARVLASAKELAITRGLSGITLDELSRHAHLSPDELGAVVRVFPDGDSVAAEVVQNLFMPLITDLSEVALRTRDVLDGLVQVGMRQTERLQREPAIYIASIQAGMRPNSHQSDAPKLTATLAAGQRQRLQILAAIVAEGQINGEIRAGDPEVIAHAIGASLLGISIKVANSSGLAAAGVYGVDVSEMALTLFARGLRAR